MAEISTYKKAMKIEHKSLLTFESKTQFFRQYKKTYAIELIKRYFLRHISSTYHTIKLYQQIFFE